MGSGNLLDNSSPLPNLSGRSVSSKDHSYSDPARINGYAIRLDDPMTLYQVTVAEQVSAVSSQPSAKATLPAGYVMTGGGCRVNWQSTPPANGNLLTGS